MGQKNAVLSYSVHNFFNLNDQKRFRYRDCRENISLSNGAFCFEKVV
jgi:hypothetical protein